MKIISENSFKICYNDSGYSVLELCKPWWISYLKNNRPIIDTSTWVEDDYKKYLNECLALDEISVDIDLKILTFKSEEHFTWFVLKWS